MPTIEIQQQKIFYAARGPNEGVPLVFLHGAGATHLVWNNQLAALAEIARVYALDLPGHGRSELPGRNAVADYTHSVRDFLDVQSIERAVIVGHSMGGAIAQMLALQDPARVLGLALIGTGARLRVRAAFLDGLQNDFANTARRISENCFAPSADAKLKEKSEQELLRCDPQVVYHDYASCDAFDVIARLGEIRVPTLILCGYDDRMTPVKYSEYLYAHIADAREEFVDGAGHMVMLERPDVVNRALGEFLYKIQKGTSAQ